MCAGPGPHMCGPAGSRMRDPGLNDLCQAPAGLLELARRRCLEHSLEVEDANLESVERALADDGMARHPRLSRAGRDLGQRLAGQLW